MPGLIDAHAHITATGILKVEMKNDAPVLSVKIDEAITQHGDVHVGIAVATPEGLITPVIRNADQKSVVEIAQEVRALAIDELPDRCPVFSSAWRMFRSGDRAGDRWHHRPSRLAYW